jgi:hypothetical protein
LEDEGLETLIKSAVGESLKAVEDKRMAQNAKRKEDQISDNRPDFKPKSVDPVK